MRILFVGDYSNLHATLAKELKKRGHEVTVLSDKGGYLDSYADIFLQREKGIPGSIKYLYNLFTILPSLKDYDIVQFINPNFLNLRPGKIKYFFDRLKNQNGKMFLTLAGNDYYYCKACLDGKLFRFSEFKIGNEFTDFHKSNPNLLYGWTSYMNRNWNEYFYDNIDGAMSVLPEYDMVAKEIIPEKTIFTNIPINIDDLPEPDYDFSYPIKLFIGIRPGTEIQKGGKKLLKIIKDIESRMSDKVIVESVSNLSVSNFIKKMSQSHIVLDQLYAYSPATTALLGMSMGKTVGSGAQEEYYNYIDNSATRPLISLSPFDTDIKERLIELIENPEDIKTRGKESKMIAENNNDVKKVVDKFIAHWQR